MSSAHGLGAGPPGRDANDRVQEIVDRFSRRQVATVASMLSRELDAEHERDPLGPHDDRLARVLRAFRRLPMDGKHIIVAEEAGSGWRIGVVRRGQAPGNVLLDDADYADPLDAMREVFRRRRRAYASEAEGEGQRSSR
jgi:hypothetical protein